MLSSQLKRIGKVIGDFVLQAKINAEKCFITRCYLELIGLILRSDFKEVFFVNEGRSSGTCGGNH